MKRSLVLTAALSAGAVLLFSSSGSAQLPFGPRAFTEQITAKTTPKRDSSSPYRFTTRGTIFVPSKYCAPGVTPSRQANCFPILCSAGVKDAAYCAHPGRAVICSGVVEVRFTEVRTTKVRRRTIHKTVTVSDETAAIKPFCTYESKASLPRSTRKGALSVTASFLGNRVLHGATSDARTVRVG